MNQFFKIIALAVIITSSSLASAAEKIAVVYPSKVMKASPQIALMKKTLSAEFKPRIDSLKALEKGITELDTKLKRDAELLSANDLNDLKRQRAVKLSEYKLEREAFAKDTRRRQGEEQQKSWKIIRDVIKNVAKNKGYDVVLNGEELLYSKSGLDISDIIIKEVSKK